MGNRGTSSFENPVPLTRHNSKSPDDEGCSQKALAPLANLFLPLSRHRRVASCLVAKLNRTSRRDSSANQLIAQRAINDNAQRT